MTPIVSRLCGALLLAIAACACAEDRAPLIVVEHGGVPASDYYGALKLQPPAAKPPHAATPPRPARPFTEESALPVTSTRLTPGRVETRSIHAPGLSPLFIVGIDSRSRAWLRERHDELSALGAVGLVVNIDSLDALKSLRRLAPGLALSPTAGNDLAQRLAIEHYPVLVTATAIEQ